MLQLHAKLNRRWDEEPFVVRVATSADRPAECRSVEMLVTSTVRGGDEGFRAVGTFDDHVSAGPGLRIPSALRYLGSGDVVRVAPRSGEMQVLYRRHSNSNAIFTTERCNSNCIMCSQPPRDVQDSYLVDAFLDAIPLMDPDTRCIGITGGEPTLLGDNLLKLIQACQAHLPNTALHILSNGRLFRYLTLAIAVGAIQHPDLMIGIPLYSDLAGNHDFVVQARGAFDQTIRGILNLKRAGVRVELRIVLHQQTVARLPNLATFIARNLPMVDHVALMGLESMGYVKMNEQAVWIDPLDYADQVSRAVDTISGAGVNASIYNHQLCVLPESLWPYARSSISDWKNEFLAVCDTCNVKARCGGFFSSTTAHHSRGIHPIQQLDLSNISRTEKEIKECCIR